MLDGELNAVMSFVVDDGRGSRVYAVRNPHKLRRLDEEAALAR
jgi:RNA polymerase sigma-70 factor (ECF subfamily)